MAVQDKTDRIKKRLQIALDNYNYINKSWFNRTFRRATVQDTADTLLYRIRTSAQWLEHAYYDESLRELLHKALQSGVLKYDLPR